MKVWILQYKNIRGQWREMIPNNFYFTKKCALSALKKMDDKFTHARSVKYVSETR